MTKNVKAVREVCIDGKRYVPVVESSADMKAIARGLLESFWGFIGDDEDLSEKMKGMSVCVFDDGLGEPIESVLASIANELAKAKANVT